MIIKNLLTILQLENYESKNFLKFSYSHYKWWQIGGQRKLDWTKKAMAIFILSMLLFCALVLLSFYFFGGWSIVVLFFMVLLLPVIIVFSLFLVVPLDMYLKNKVVKDAKKILDSHRGHLKIIGITGSYGKTSTKELLYEILSSKLKIFKLDGNINTDIGIAEAIIAKQSTLQDKQVFIIEMGAFRRGDIKKICDFIEPDFSVLTGINESHLEKFLTIENTIKTKFELPEATKELSVLNFNDLNVKNNYNQFKIKNFVGVERKNTEIKEIESFGGIEFIIDGQIFRTKLLAKHNVDLICLCIEVAKKLNFSLYEIAQAIEKIKPVKHRLELIYNSVTNIYVIDDSYNGNINGFFSGVEVLSRAKGRKIILTPGLVEQGDKEKDIHQRIGMLYSINKIDLVLLINSHLVNYIIDGIKLGDNKVDYKVYDTTAEAHADLINVLRSGDTILFQNDWTENYY